MPLTLQLFSDMVRESTTSELDGPYPRGVGRAPFLGTPGHQKLVPSLVTATKAWSSCWSRLAWLSVPWSCLRPLLVAGVRLTSRMVGFCHFPRFVLRGAGGQVARGGSVSGYRWFQPASAGGDGWRLRFLEWRVTLILA